MTLTEYLHKFQKVVIYLNEQRKNNMDIFYKNCHQGLQLRKRSSVQVSRFVKKLAKGKKLDGGISPERVREVLPELDRLDVIGDRNSKAQYEEYLKVVGAPCTNIQASKLYMNHGLVPQAVLRKAEDNKPVPQVDDENQHLNFFHLRLKSRNMSKNLELGAQTIREQIPKLLEEEQEKAKMTARKENAKLDKKK